MFIISNIERLLIESNWVDNKATGKKVDLSFSISPLWNFDVKLKGTRNILTGNIDEPTEVYIDVSPGPWVKKCLNKEGMQEGNAVHQFGWIVTEILKIDSYRDGLALKVATEILIMSRIKLGHTNQYVRIVGHFLETVENKEKINKAREDFRKAYMLKKRWDKALSLLMEMDWDIDFDSTTYPEWLRPNSKVKKPAGRKIGKIIDLLCKAKITIKPPDSILSLLAVRAEPKRIKVKKSKERHLTGVQIREARQAKGWNQRYLAAKMKISQSMLAQIELDQRSLKPRIETKLRRFLEI
ncbi:MAG: helix-turn-helix domain-containing protein [Aulosira sp. DedQUE10]|nr:helix-turn-helix domain-containing protein [Aulosira sp. DedQUE10]